MNINTFVHCLKELVVQRRKNVFLMIFIDKTSSGGYIIHYTLNKYRHFDTF